MTGVGQKDLDHKTIQGVDPTLSTHGRRAGLRTRGVHAGSPWSSWGELVLRGTPPA